MSDNTRFFISTPSRHPMVQKAYDSIIHQYKKDYVNPKSWDVDLRFMPKGFKEDAKGKIVMPSHISSIRWTISKAGLEDLKIEARGKSMALATISLSEQGTYGIELLVRLANGKKETEFRTFRFRDFLVVSIGDSYASGQGVPDVNAVQSEDQKLLCKPTTLFMMIHNGIPKLAGWIKGNIEKRKKFIADNIPLFGTLAVTALDKAEDISGLLISHVKNIKDRSVALIRTIGDFVGESIEEGLGFVGIGDGGEFEDVGPKPAVWQEPMAYRSYKSGPSLAAKAVERDTTSGADRITFLTFARSGAEVEDGLLRRKTDIDVIKNNNIPIEGWIGNRDQVQEAEETIKNRPIDALVISISGNDMGFSSLTTDSVLRSNGAERKKRIDEAKKKIKNELEGKLFTLNKEINQRLKPRRVFITEYPVGLFKEVITDGPCGVLASKFPIGGDLQGFDLDRNEAAGLTELGVLLNLQIRNAAQQFGWVFIEGIEAAFDGHGYCAKNSFFVSAEESCRHQGDFEGMLHPNAKGHEIIGEFIASALRREMLTSEVWLEPVLHVMMR